MMVFVFTDPVSLETLAEIYEQMYSINLENVTIFFFIIPILKFYYHWKEHFICYPMV